MSEPKPEPKPKPKPSVFNETPAFGLALCLLGVACLLGAWLLVQLGPSQPAVVSLRAPDGTRSDVQTTATVSCSSVMRGSGLGGDGETKNRGMGSAQDDDDPGPNTTGLTIDGESLYELDHSGDSPTSRLGSELDPSLCDKLRARRLGHAGELSVAGVLVFGAGSVQVALFGVRRRLDGVQA